MALTGDQQLSLAKYLNTMSRPNYNHCKLAHDNHTHHPKTQYWMY